MAAASSSIYLIIFEQTSPLYYKISNISFFIELLPVVLYLFFKRRINDKAVRVILLLVLFGFFTDSLTIYQTANRFRSEVGANLFTLIETLLLGYFFREILVSKLSRRIILYLLVAFTAAWGVLFIQHGRDTYLEIFVTIESIIVLALSIYYFFEQVKKPDSLFIYNQPRFWIVAGYLLYAAGTFFLFLYLASLNKEDQNKYFILNSIFLIIKTIFLSIAMCMKGEQNEQKKFELH